MQAARSQTWGRAFVVIARKGAVLNRRESYADLGKWRMTCNRQRARYYGKTAFAAHHNERWTDGELAAVMAHEVTDRELAARLGRSIGAIQTMRSRLKSKRGKTA